jgi:SAM-dependent methyltransferase
MTSLLYQKYRMAWMSLTERFSRPTHAGIPIPPPRMRQLTTAGRIGADQHIREGPQVAQKILEVVEAEKANPRAIEKVLDFGCGCGRVLRHMSALWPQAQLCGADVDEGLLSWNRENLSRLANWTKIEHRPPTEFASAIFDIIYAVSVFTHMDEKNQLGWIEEFQRILKPNGLLLISVIPLKEGEINRSWDYSDPRGMGYRFRRREVVKRSWLKRQSEIPFYIDTKHSEEYCRTVWSDFLEFRGFIPGAVRGYQSLAVLRKAAGQ